jgi:hypothetical protein
VRRSSYITTFTSRRAHHVYFWSRARSRAQRHTPPTSIQKPYLRHCSLACLAAHVRLFLFHSSENVTDVHKVASPKLTVLASGAFINSVIMSTCERRHPFIHTLNDDVLLDVFYLCGPGSSIQDEEDNARISIWWPGLDQHVRWWYKLAHVCRQWRYLILASPSPLRLRLFFRPGTPVANMLIHSQRGDTHSRAAA